MNRTRKFFVWLLLPLVLGTGAALPASADRIFTDSAGREILFSNSVNKLAPSGTIAQIMLYTLCPEKLVGIATDFPKESQFYINSKYLRLPKFGQFYGKNMNLNMEALIAAAPETVVDIGEDKKEIKEDMDSLQAQLNIPVVFVKATLDTMGDAYEKLGELTGDKDRAATLAASSRKVLKDAERCRLLIPQSERVSVYLAMGKAGLNTNARGSFHAEVFDKVGVVNAADIEAVSTGGGSVISMEQLLNWNPDIILADSEELYQTLVTDLLWKDLDAVKKGRVYKTPTAPYSFLNNPPSVNRLAGIQWLGHLAYPKLYTSDLKKSITEFYNTFYSINLTDTQLEEILKHAM